MQMLFPGYQKQWQEKLNLQIFVGFFKIKYIIKILK